MEAANENTGEPCESRSFIQPDPEGIQAEVSVSGRPSGAVTGAASNLLLRRILDADYSFRWGNRILIRKGQDIDPTLILRACLNLDCLQLTDILYASLMLAFIQYPVLGGSWVGRGQRTAAEEV